MQHDRRLVAIFAADVAGFARSVGSNETETLHTLRSHLEIVNRLIVGRGGRVANTAGDSVLAEFPSAVHALQCAVEVQREIAEANDALAPDRRLELRIGLHVGDVVVSEGDLLGDSVNIAARLEGFARPGGVCVSSAVYEHVRRLLPYQFSDLGSQTFKNIDEPVRAFALTSDLPPRSIEPGEAEPHAPLPLPDKPSIAVLPFVNMSGDADQEYFADGLVEELITGLSRVKAFFVIARNSTFVYKGRHVDVRQVSRDLGVRYVLEGSIRRAGSRVRITGQLIDATTGHHVWADRFEGDIFDIFELQDQVTDSVVGAVEPSIRLQEIRQARTKPTSSVTAYDLYLRALPRFYSMTREGFSEVRRLTNEALTIDPEFTLAKALGAYIRSLSVSQVWHEPDDVKVAVRMAGEVLAEARDDPTCLRFAAQVLAYSACEYDRALAAIERSLSLNPSSAQGYTGSGWVHAHAGLPDVAIEHFHRALRLSPLDPEKGIALSGMGMSYLMLGRLAEALQVGESALREMNYASAHRVVINALVGLGRLEEARAAAHRLMTAFPTYTLTLQRQINPWRDKAFAERYVEALRVAGVPE